MRRQSLKSLILLSLFSLIALGLLEGTLRLLGYKPFKPIPPLSQTKSSEFDKELGWRLIPGHYEIGPFNDIGDSMSITIKKDTGRVTRLSNLGVSEGQISFIGGSFIMGHALDDDETAVWKLQERFPQFDFRNLAVSAYGGLQSLIVLEEELEKGNTPKCVIYGAFQHHELRNVAQVDWLMELRRKVPYVILKNDSTFEKMGLAEMKRLPLSSGLASVYLAEKAFNRMFPYGSAEDARRLSHLIIKEMHRLASQHQIAFYVALLNYDEQGVEDMTEFVTEAGIDYIDCNVPLTKKNMIRDDGHPDESVNDIWVERIADRLIMDSITNSL